MKNKRVLVTGSSGFIGSHVADALEGHGFNVALFDIVPNGIRIDNGEWMIFKIIISVTFTRTNNKPCRFFYPLFIRKSESTFITYKPCSYHTILHPYVNLREGLIRRAARSLSSAIALSRRDSYSVFKASIRSAEIPIRLNPT